ncbi:MAG: hypothetical protein ACK56I_10290, partial [bacterium]
MTGDDLHMGRPRAGPELHPGPAEPVGRQRQRGGPGAGRDRAQRHLVVLEPQRGQRRVAEDQVNTAKTPPQVREHIRAHAGQD